MQPRRAPVPSPPPRLRTPRPGSLNWLPLCAAAALAACAAPPPVMIRVENHQVQPPQSLSLISEEHPQHPDPMDFPAFTKPAPPDLMEQLLELFDQQGFDRWARPEPAWTMEVTPLPVLRRLVLDVDGQTRSLVVPRAPDPELAACFTTLARAVSAAFNEVEFLRLDRVERESLSGDPLENPLEAEQDRLRRDQERRQKDGGR